MLEVKAKYFNCPHITKTSATDYFIYIDVEVKGHAEHTGYNNNTRVCAGVSACTLGIIRLINEGQFQIEHRHGYFHIWTNRHLNSELNNTLDRESVYAINTMVCQLYEIYCNYPTAFKCFDLIDVKEIIKDEQNKTNQWCDTTKRRSTKARMGLYSIIKGINLKEY